MATRKLVASFYESFRQFVASPAYNPDEWEKLTLGEYLLRQLKMPEARLRKLLARYPARGSPTAKLVYTSAIRDALSGGDDGMDVHL